jgi:tryptophan-rich sensory protein
MTRTQVLKLIVSVILPVLVGGIAGLFTAEAVPGWYATLKQPSFNPPNWIFGPVWTILYLLMGISLFLVWKENHSKERNIAITVFLIQLALNFAWSLIFFHFKMIGLALVEISLLWISILSMLFIFYKIKPAAAYINIPYLLWVAFATVLNASYYILNKI